MKKTLLAAALMAGFAGIAQAETSVTLYGILDGGIGFQQLKGSTAAETSPFFVDEKEKKVAAPWYADRTSFKNKRTGLIGGIQSGNRWGLKGSEDLGNGLRAVFVLESGFNIANGDQLQGGRLFGRQATLGLAGDSWGQLDFGRQTNIASKYFGSIDPFGTAF
ncbi:MAG: porin, partial [Alcaligenaceae bacterium]|nr:porin [Alcaligenaceae bacterium]